MAVQGRTTVTRMPWRSMSGATIDRVHTFLFVGHSLYAAFSISIGALTTHSGLLNNDGHRDALSGMAGPWAFIYFHRASCSLYFGRDRLGRRSLCLLEDPRCVCVCVWKG